MLKKFFIALCELMIVSMSASSQTEWNPTCEFPLLFPRMEKATIHYGLIKDYTKLIPCNIHIGTAQKYQELIYLNDNGLLMEIDPSSLNYVEFPDGKYMPIEQKYFGKIIREDSIGKIVMVRDLDRDKLLEIQRTTLSISSKIDISILGGKISQEELSIVPMYTKFFFVFNKEIFEVTDKNILAHINQSRRKEYRAYTRAAELISTNESSVVKLWEDFFVNYDKVLKFYKNR